MRPNYIPGMRYKGTRKNNLVPHYKKREAKYLVQEAKTRKKELEHARKFRANLPYED